MFVKCFAELISFLHLLADHTDPVSSLNIINKLKF